MVEKERIGLTNKDIFKGRNIHEKKDKKETSIGFRLSNYDKKKVDEILMELSKKNGVKYGYSFLATNLINSTNNPIFTLKEKQKLLENKLNVLDFEIEMKKKEKDIIKQELDSIRKEIDEIDPSLKYDGNPNYIEALEHMKLLIRERNITKYEDITEEMFVATKNTYNINKAELKEIVKINFDLLI